MGKGSVFWAMACRPDLLRGGRSLRDLYTGFALSSRWSAQRLFAAIGRTTKVIAPRAVGLRGASLLEGRIGRDSLVAVGEEVLLGQDEFFG
jgi:hypothetical protein